MSDGQYVLNATTVSDDGDADKMRGRCGHDWWLFDTDGNNRIRDLRRHESVLDVGTV
jgi:hypothetical protein|tara:strand:- start:4539 stop:4709 length:171 start_codon:yes stop_codon:yes gene_type:complete